MQKFKLIDVLRRQGVMFCDLDSLLPDGMVRDQKHVESVVQHFRAKQIDALFILHCNFGKEGAAVMIAKQCGVPVLFWGGARRSAGSRRVAVARYVVRDVGNEQGAAHVADDAGGADRGTD